MLIYYQYQNMLTLIEKKYKKQFVTFEELNNLVLEVLNIKGESQSRRSYQGLSDFLKTKTWDWAKRR